MSLRAAGPAEAAAVAATLAALHAAAFPPAEAWGPDALQLMLEMSGSFALIQDGQGFILARTAADEAEILTLAVVPAARRRGLGGTLLASAMAAARARGATTMVLEVAEGNAAARALYAAGAFRPVGRRSRYYPDGGDALVLRRELA